jgi:hypothetical protein
MALTAIDKSANGNATMLLLRFKQYERRDRMLWLDATAKLRRQSE